jgi:hypothetical protein
MDLPQKKNFLFEKNFKKLSQKIASQSNTKKRKLKMALRLLPFRQYDEQDVINLYSLNLAASDAGYGPDTNGVNDNGVVVSVTSGDFDAGIDFAYGDTANTYGKYLGKTGYPHVGRNGYPQVTGMQVTAAAVGTATDEPTTPLGITLRQTLTHDENGEKLLYYRQKMIELQAVLPGEVVPVLTRGVVTLANTAFADDGEPDVGDAVYTAAAGKLTKTADGDGAGKNVYVGRCLAKGTRKAYGTSDQFAGNPNDSSYAGESYYVIKIEL